MVAEIFQWALLTLFAYRVQRIITTDSWPPSRWFRTKFRDHYSEDSAVFDFFTCGWCIGSWLTFAIFALATLWLSIPLVLLQAVASAAIVGKLANDD